MLPGTAVGDGFRPGANARRRCNASGCCGEDLELPMVAGAGGGSRGGGAGLAEWRDQFLAAGQASLKSRAPDARDEANRRLQAQDVGAIAARRVTDGERSGLYAKVDQLEAGRPWTRPGTEVEATAEAGAHAISDAYRAYRRGSAAGLPRVWHRARGPAVDARRQATPGPLAGARGRSAPRPDARPGRHILAACSRRRRFTVAKGTGKPGRSFGSSGIRTSQSSGCARLTLRWSTTSRPPHRVGHAHGPKAETTGRHHHRGDLPRCDVGHGHDDRR